jgi:uncharacterized damage-inducible protein DinB
MTAEAEPTLMEFIRYDTWANLQVLAVCQAASEELLTSKIPGAYGSILDTFRHMLWAEGDYIKRITGTAPQPPSTGDDWPGFAAMSAYAAQLGAAFLEVLQSVPPTQMVHEEDNGFFLDYQARQLFMQVINHGIEHRTNITTFLTTHGVSLPELDGWGYMWTHRDQFAVKEGKLGNS